MAPVRRKSNTVLFCVNPVFTKYLYVVFDTQVFVSEVVSFHEVF